MVSTHKNLVSWAYYSQYMEKCSKPPIRLSNHSQMSARGIDVYWVCYKVWLYHIMIHYDGIMYFQLFCESIGKLASQWLHAPCLLQAIVHLGRVA